MNANDIRDFIKVLEATDIIVYNADIDWEYKFDYMFRIFKPIAYELMGRFDWLDMDTSYEEDAMNFYRAAKDKFYNWDGRNNG